MDEKKIVENFMGCIHCSQIVVGEMAEKLGVDKDLLMKLAGPLGGGCFHGEACGCVTAAMMSIGLKCGHCKLNDVDTNNKMVGMIHEFEERFIEQYGSLKCVDLSGHDFSKEGEFDKAFKENVFVEKCPKYVNTTLDILDDMIG